MASDEPISGLDNHNGKRVEKPAENEVNVEEENQPTGKVRSIVWQHFPYKKGATSTKCKYCKQIMACGKRTSGTSALHNHLVNVCRNSPLYKKSSLNKQSTLSFKPTNKGENEIGSLATYKFSQEKCRLALAKMCIKDNQPFSLVDDEGFRELVWELNPHFKFNSRWTVARDCLAIFEEEAKKVKDMLKGQTVCLTTDTWSSVQNYNYMCLTAHWINDDWVLPPTLGHLSNYAAYFRSEMEDEGSTRKRKRNNKVIGAPSEADWEKARNLIDYLKIFSDVTTKISGSKYVTSNIFFSELVKMQATITRMCSSLDEHKKNMAISMKAKYDKYWDNIENMNYLLYVAVALDPRNKIRYVTFCIEMIHGKNSEKSKEILGKVRSTLQDLFNDYKNKVEKNKVQITVDGVCSDRSTSFGNTNIELELEFDKYDDEDHDDKNEVEVYLADGKEKRDGNFDLLGWWKANSTKFPILSKIARHVFAMPISTVASESAFSTGGRVIDKYRSSLTTKTAEALICTQDWIRSTPADIELVGTMPHKQIEELNEKLAAIEIVSLSKHKKSSKDAEPDVD